MRLLYFTNETWPNERPAIAAMYGKYLPRRGVHTDLVAGHATNHLEDREWTGGSAFLCETNGGRTKKRIKTFLHGIRILLSVKNENYQAIQMRDLPLLATVGILIAKLKGLQFFFFMSFPMPEGHISNARARGLSQGILNYSVPWMTGKISYFLQYKIVLPAADHVFVQSAQMKKDMIMRNIDASKMSPVPMGIDTEELRIEGIKPIEDPRLNDRRVLVYLGTLDKSREIEKLFEVLSKVHEKIPETILILVGDTKDNYHRSWLKDQARKAGVNDHVIWTGWVAIREGWRYVRTADIGLSPFPRGFLLDSATPTKVPEYLALGIPVVCNDNPDQKAIVEKSHSGKSVPYDADSFASAIVQLLELEKGTLKEMGERGRNYVTSTRNYERLSECLAKTYLEHLN